MQTVKEQRGVAVKQIINKWSHWNRLGKQYPNYYLQDTNSISKINKGKTRGEGKNVKEHWSNCGGCTS